MVFSNGEESGPHRRIRLEDFDGDGPLDTDSQTVEQVRTLWNAHRNLDAGEIFDMLKRQGYQPPAGSQLSVRAVAAIIAGIRRSAR